MRWLRHVAHMVEMINALKILVRNRREETKWKT
jgi:hypothetical protein